MSLQRERPSESEDVRSNILNAALQLFGQRGYHSTSLQEIIDMAGCSKGGFYHHFESKEDLLLMFHDTFIDHLLDYAQGVQGEPCSPVDRLQRIFTQLLESMSKFRNHMAVFQHESRFLTQKKFAIVHAKRDRYELIIRSLVMEGIAAGELREDLDPKLFALALLGAFNWAFRWFKPGRPMSPKEMSQAMLTMILDGGRKR